MWRTIAAWLRPPRIAPATTGAEEPMVMVHGGMWKVADVVDNVRRYRALTWRAQTWRRGPALVHRRGGRVSYYDGQAFDPAKIDLVQDGWSHDHCLICWFDIGDLDGHRDAFTDGDQRWICAECHEQFIRRDAAGIENSTPAGGVERDEA